jgi:hypothetical protein
VTASEGNHTWQGKLFVAILLVIAYVLIFKVLPALAMSPLAIETFKASHPVHCIGNALVVNEVMPVFYCDVEAAVEEVTTQIIIPTKRQQSREVSETEAVETSQNEPQPEQTVEEDVTETDNSVHPNNGKGNGQELDAQGNDLDPNVNVHANDND